MRIILISACLLFIQLIIIRPSYSQQKAIDFRSIDFAVSKIEAFSPIELSQKLTTNYSSAIEKARAIFSWEAQHINYETSFDRKPAKLNAATSVSPEDTSSQLLPLDDRVAYDVLKKRSAMCYGYSRLFKSLCDHAGIPCEVINGYARGDFYRVGNNFRTNHSWNAIQLDSIWYLVDVTWASGYFTYNTNQFIKNFDDQYFMTPPSQFALDHFPDDLKWSLLEKTPPIDEFRNSPYKSRYFTKYEISSFWPKEGVIKATVGDTIHLRVELNLAEDRKIGGGSIFDDSTSFLLKNAVFCKPLANGRGKIAEYLYIPDSEEVQWLQLVYNDDMILRYRLVIHNRGDDFINKQ